MVKTIADVSIPFNICCYCLYSYIATNVDVCHWKSYCTKILVDSEIFYSPDLSHFYLMWISLTLVLAPMWHILILWYIHGRRVGGGAEEVGWTLFCLKKNKKSSWNLNTSGCCQLSRFDVIWKIWQYLCSITDIGMEHFYIWKALRNK